MEQEKKINKDLGTTSSEQSVSSVPEDQPQDVRTTPSDWSFSLDLVDPPSDLDFTPTTSSEKLVDEPEAQLSGTANLTGPGELPSEVGLKERKNQLSGSSSDAKGSKPGADTKQKQESAVLPKKKETKKLEEEKTKKKY